MRTTLLAIFGLVSASGCTGIIESGGGDDVVPPPPTDVQIVVRDGTLPQANVEVIFQNADDSLIEDVMTDATGLARAEMPNGGSVQVIRLFPLPPAPADPRPPEVYTYVGVKAGDRLVLGQPEDTAAPVTAINVVVPSTAQGTVRVNTACGEGQGTAPNIAITVQGCTPDAFYVMDGDNSSFFAHVPYAPSVDLSMQDLIGALTSSLSSTNVLPGVTVSVEKRLESAGWTIFTSNAQRVETNPASVNLPPLEGVEERVISMINDGNNRTQVVTTHAAFARGPTIIDATVGLITYVSEAPTYDPMMGITWKEENPGAADFTVTTLTVNRGGNGNPNNNYYRSVIAPYGATPVLRLPVLSGAALLFNPTMDDQITVTLGLAKVTGGYDAMRATAFTAPSIVDTTPMDGQLTLSYNGNAPGL